MFKSFFFAGFECATGYNALGEWIDQVAATHHDKNVDEDYQRLKDVGIYAAREAIRWPLVGYTWWPLFALVTWGYRQGRHPAAYYLKQMGLWDLDPDPEANLARVKTTLVDDYKQLVRGGAKAVGSLPTERMTQYV